MAESDLPTEEDKQFEWELYRENVKPMKHGRRVNAINKALTQPVCNVEKAATAKLEEYMEQADNSEDPLPACLDFCKWFEDSYPSGKQRIFYSLLWKIVHKYILNDDRYKQDERTLRIWQALADNGMGHGYEVYQHAHHSEEEDALEMREMRRQFTKATVGNSDSDEEYSENETRQVFSRVAALDGGAVPVIRLPSVVGEQGPRTLPSVKIQSRQQTFEVFNDDEKEQENYLEAIYDIHNMAHCSHIDRYTLTENNSAITKLVEATDPKKKFTLPAPSFTVWEDDKENIDPNAEKELLDPVVIKPAAAPKPKLAFPKEFLNIAMEGPSTITPPSTAGPTATTTGGSTGNGGTTMESSTSMGNTASTIKAAPPEEELKKDPKKFKAVPLYMDHELDPLASHMNLLHKYLSAPEHACNNQFTDLNSISEHQLYGFIASLATTDVGPFCSICHRMVDEVRKRAAVVGVLVSEDEQLLGKILHSHIPSTKSICSALAPACYDNYEENVVNITSGLLCAECSACMIVTNILQHRLLLKPTAVAALYNFLKETLFHNICAELCNAFTGQDFVKFLWPKGFTFDGCQNWFQGVFNGAIRFVTTVTRPERFCSLELGWCELNEVPNMLQCLPEFCEDFLGSNPLLRLLCNLLPGDKEEAAKFLNVHHTKRYKEKKAYHDEISVGHQEL